MITDPVLKAHQIVPPFSLGPAFKWAAPTTNWADLRNLALQRALFPPMFNLSGKLTPVSIRDQMVRGQLLAARAHEERIVYEDYPVLVIGAGAAGVSVAMSSYLQRHCVPTVVEARTYPFGLQAGCTTRWISPTQYDWPVGHWNGAAFPVGPGWRPLPWIGDRSHSVAALWNKALAASGLHVDFSSTVRRIWILPRSDGHYPTAWAAEYWSDGAWRVRQFGAIVIAIGFGEERYKFLKKHGGTDYTSRPFWSDDQLETAHYGFLASPTVLISGSGDGGLQDFLRITTNCKSVQDIMARLPDITADTSTLQDEEDWAGRGHHWGANEHHDHPVLHRLHESHKNAVETVLARKDVIKALHGIIRETLPPVRLVHSCTHFAGAYPLNRFLALLVARFIENELKQKNPLVQGYRLREIRSHDRTCRGHYVGCEGKDHQVTLEEHLDCRAASAGVRARDPDDWPAAFNLIIIRHGIDFQPPSTTPKVPFVDLPRQTMPYDYPQ